ncbi:hypothetical protein MK805_14050 [Shimazuella sp. AN120528]|uniref:hypothetical protein n=1 Tax=Shimazuella soli TaxID=1892854 RepID=UPI001F0D261A|nr:hypothetical protein [Shimazuella soli]MCH5586060.1 hypothetical protein [Shimazuella soli]
MSFQMITIGSFDQITSYLNKMQAIASYEYKPIYKQLLEKNEFLIVFNCKQRHNELETHHFTRIEVQAQDEEEEVAFTLTNVKVIDTGKGVIHIKGKLE